MGVNYTVRQWYSFLGYGEGRTGRGEGRIRSWQEGGLVEVSGSYALLWTRKPNTGLLCFVRAMLD